MVSSRKAILCSVLVAALACACAKKGPSGSEEFVEWVSEHLIAVESVDSPVLEADLQAIRTAIGPAQVVGLGESRHDTREQLLLKALLVKHLIEDLGFRALILEESFPHAESLDRYVTSGEGDLRELLNGLAGWYLWDTEEMLRLLRWIRQFNERCPPGREVRIFGMDITAPALGVQGVLDYLDAAGVGTWLSPNALGLGLQHGDFWPRTLERYATLSDERRAEIRNSYAQLVKVLRTERTKLVASSSEQEYGRMQLMGEIGKMGNEMFSSADPEEAGTIRERGMAEAALWILDREVAGGKAIIWAHNLHVARSSFRMPAFAEGELVPMGARLSEELGEAYLAIGGAFGSGSFPPDLPPGERLFEVASSDVVDGALAEVGVPCYLVDLRGAEPQSGAAGWLQQDREWRAQDSSAWLVPGAAFDLVYFVSDISRSLPTPLALRRFESFAGQR